MICFEFSVSAWIGRQKAFCLLPVNSAIINRGSGCRNDSRSLYSNNGRRPLWYCNSRNRGTVFLRPWSCNSFCCLFRGYDPSIVMSLTNTAIFNHPASWLDLCPTPVHNRCIRPRHCRILHLLADQSWKSPPFIVCRLEFFRKPVTTFGVRANVDNNGFAISCTCFIIFTYARNEACDPSDHPS